MPQGREILSMQLRGGAARRIVSAIPAGTMLRAFYVTERGDAFVDLSAEVSSKHPGGSFTELLTVYAIVNAVTANLPTIQRVQILIDGKEAETLAGHVDLRRPLIRRRVARQGVGNLIAVIDSYACRRRLSEQLRPTRITPST